VAILFSAVSVISLRLAFGRGHKDFVDVAFLMLLSEGSFHGDFSFTVPFFKDEMGVCFG